MKILCNQSGEYYEFSMPLTVVTKLIYTNFITPCATYIKLRCGLKLLLLIN